MAIIVSDKQLFTIILYAAFVNGDHLEAIRDIWKIPWVTGGVAASTIGIVGLVISPMILIAIIYGLGFGAEGIAAGSFGSWFMSLYGGTIARGSLISILQSIGAAGLGTLGTSISSGFGAAIGILIGAFGGAKLAKHFSEMDLIDSERQIFENFILIEEKTSQNNNTVIFTLMPALLYNDVMLQCFVETFISCASFAYSNLFKFNFKENDLSKLKSEQEKVNHTVYDLLISTYEQSRVEQIFHNEYLIGHKLNLSDYKPSNRRVNLLVEVWHYLNGVTVVNIDIDKIRNQINDEFHHQVKNVDKTRQYVTKFFRDKFDKYHF